MAKKKKDKVVADGVTLPLDAYFTPRWVIQQLLVEVLPVAGGKAFDRRRETGQPTLILDAGAGRGAFGQVLREQYGYSVKLIGVERFPEMAKELQQRKLYDAVAPGDFLEFNPKVILPDREEPMRFDFSFGNPPFSLAREFAERSRKLAAITILLLRQGFLSSEKRALWYRKHPPESVHILANRPAFPQHELDPEFRENQKQTDKADYCWVVWRRDPARRTTLHWLSSVPTALRLG